MDVSVVISTYNRWDSLKETIKSLSLQDYPEDRYEIIVVDDGSTDGTEKKIHSFSSGGLRYLRHPERMGQSRARNLGIKEARGEIVIFVDSDIIAPPHFIQEHMRSHERHKDVVVDGPAILINDLKEVGHWSKRLLASLDLFGKSFITANTSCPKRVLLLAGGFDEDFGSGFGWQDRELGLRLTQMGIRRIKNRRAFAYHLREERSYTPEEILQKWKERGRNAVLFYTKHPSPKVWWEVKFYYLWYSRFLPSSHIHAYTQGLREGLRRYRAL
jgi:glycosyltransferase involved in cell wall biosynthesis